MREGTGAPKKLTKEQLEPDTFWDLVEKLLLLSTNDEQHRLRHNVSLSALCRGNALLTLQRGLATKQTTSTVTAADNKKPIIPENTKQKPDEKFLEDKEQVSIESEKRYVSAKQTHSECNVSDSDIVFVKESEVPASERLWRFAIRNRKYKLDIESNVDLSKTMPRVQSNEAIYEGLQRRIEEAKEDKNEEIPDNKSKAKQKQESHKPDEVHKHRCESVTNNYNPMKNKPKSKRSKSRKKSTTKNPKSVLPHQKDSADQNCHDLDPTPLQNLIKSSETDASDVQEQNLVKTFESERSNISPEHFEAKKSLYDSVLRKRLSCGCQLEVLNREIINNRLYPRMLLSRETTKKYAALKKEYLNLCYQESSLRSQIAMLQTEIYMIHNKDLHKKQAVIKTITLGSKSAHVPQIDSSSNAHSPETDSDNKNALLFPRLKPQKPLSLAQQRPFCHNNDRTMPAKKFVHNKDSPQPKRNATSRDKCASTSFPSIEKNMSPKGICSLYSLTTSLRSPRKRKPDALLVPQKEELEKKKTVHRLTKMNIDLKTKT